MTPAPAAARPRAPDAFDRFGQWLGERVNPIVLKEIRQGLRTRVFGIFFSLMLLACVVISLVALATAQDLSSQGKAYFIAYDMCLGLVQFFVIPYSAFRSMAREREEETWVLLTLTGLGPRRILRGKMGSFTLLGVLYTSAAAPFMLFSYYLNGIDLLTIVVAVIAGVAWQLFLTSICVSMATMAESRIMRAVLPFVTMGILLQGLWIGLVSMFGVVERLRQMLSGDATTLVAIGLLFMMCTWSVLLYEAAAARMSLVTESYARGPRLALLVQLLGMMGLFVCGALQTSERDLPAVGAIVCSAHLFVVGLFVASDHDGMARALWRKSPRASLLEPGALRGFRLVMLLYAAIALVFIAVEMVFKKNGHPTMVLAAPAYGALYVATPIVLARLAGTHPTQAPRLTRVLGIGLFVVGAGAPPLLGALASKSPTLPLINLWNPVVGLFNLAEQKGDPALHLIALWGTTLVLVLAAQGMLLRRDNPPKVEAA